MYNRLLFLLFNLTLAIVVSRADAQQIEIPRRHDRPPNAPFSAAEAAARMTVPAGFSVEVVAAEPDVMNPVAMCIDERGRFWITESFEYPRKEAGSGRDRVKILEDTDGDGKVDKVTVFAEGLNIPSGIAVGYGGVWICNAPDLLFMQDTDGDGKADRTEVIVTGFGRTDTHELPNSLTWGPDGWLYGLNGVFNYCKVTYPPSNPHYQPGQKSIDFTAAMFRVHPRTREFQIYAQGTSNPWGIAINGSGDFFISACVIDHLWHIVETGYYIRQGGPYPPYTWPIRSIVQHKHQKAAYCGITWFDSDAYPPEYRNVLYMGNIHGGCINADLVDRSGSTYQGRPHPGFTAQPDAWKDDPYGVIAKTGDPDHPKLADFLTANDAWFMPVVQKVGPDGCLYVLDWYDRYHCYQDANADPAGVDRAKGRLYRVRYQETPHAAPFNLNQRSDDELIALLGNPNVYFRETAQRLLAERTNPDIIGKLITVFKNEKLTTTNRMCALFALGACGISGQDLLKLTVVGNGPFLPWLTRMMTHHEQLQASANQHASGFKIDDWKRKSPSAPEVFLQETIGWSLLKDDAQAQGMLLLALEEAENETHIQQIIWQNVKPRIAALPDLYLKTLTERWAALDHYQPILARSLPLVCENQAVDGGSIGRTMNVILSSRKVDERTKSDCLQVLQACYEDGLLKPERLADMMGELKSSMDDLTTQQKNIVTVLQAYSGDQPARKLLKEQLTDQSAEQEIRINALRTLVRLQDSSVINVVASILAEPTTTKELRVSVLDVINRLNLPQVAQVLMANFSTFEPDVQPKVVEVLTQRPGWSLVLLREIEAGKIDKSLVNLNQLIRMNSFKEASLQQLLTRQFGVVRMERSNRQGFINQKKDFLRGTPGDPYAGRAVFKRVCAQCHQLYGEGADVGPDITRNGRSNWDQLLQNVFDPSAVIGPGYQARMIATEDGRVLTGLPVEDSPERVVLKIQGGKREIIPRDQIEADKLSELSLMPEDIEKLMTPQELADLLAFLSLDKPPEDETARMLPGAPPQKRR